MSKENISAKVAISPELKSSAIELISDLKECLAKDKEFGKRLVDTFLYKPVLLLENFSLKVGYNRNGYECSFTEDFPNHDNKIRFSRMTSGGESFESFEIDLKTLGRREDTPVIKYFSRNMYGEIGDINLSDTPDAIEKVRTSIKNIS